MSWGEVGSVVVLLGSPAVIGVLVGMYYRIRFRCELNEAKALARKMYRELDEARYELEQMQEALKPVEADPPTTELPALRHPLPGRPAATVCAQVSSSGQMAWMLALTLTWSD